MAAGASSGGDRRQRQLRAAETRLLFDNGYTGIVITILITGFLAYAEWHAIPHLSVLLWVSYMLLVSAERFVIVRRYRRASPSEQDAERWNSSYLTGAA